MEWLKQLASYAGPVALAAFAGTFLGGVALSFFWKNFGPWKLLESARKEIETCEKLREEESKDREKLKAAMADLNARYEILHQAVRAANLGLKLG